MKGKMIEAFSKNLIKHRDFLPLKDEEGNIVAGDTASILIRSSMGSLVILELIDGDVLSAEDIRRKLEENTGKLQGLKAAQYHYIFEVFLFESEPTQDKVGAITSGQFQKTMEKKFLKCISVYLDAKNIQKHFKLPLTDFGITKSIQSQLDSGFENISTGEEIEEIIRQKESERTIELKTTIPVVTYVLIALNVLVWGLLNIYSIQSGRSFNELLSVFGAKENTKIILGEYWRFLTPVFLHSGIIHLLVNCYSLYAVGVTVERMFGRIKFISIYLAAGVAGNIASFIFSTNPAVGASGAIFGLMGALLYFGIKKPALFKATFGYNLIVIILFNLVYGFTNSGIDNYAHLGGLAGGFLITGALSPTIKKKWFLNRFVFVGLTLILICSGLLYGFNNRQNKALALVNEMEKYNAGQEWNNVEKTAEEILSLQQRNVNVNIEALWMLTVAEAVSNKYDEAVVHAQMLKDVSPKDGHYLLGLLYYDAQQYDRSREELLQAKKLNAGYANIDEILGNIDNMAKSK